MWRDLVFIDFSNRVNYFVVFLTLMNGVRLKLCQMMNLRKSTINQHGLQPYLQVSKVWVRLELSRKLLVALYIVISVGILNVCDKRMFLADFDIVVS